MEDLTPSEPFFPNQPSLLLEQEQRIRAIAAQLEEEKCLELYSAISACAPSLSTTFFTLEGEIAIAEQQGYGIAFPRPVPMVKMSHIIFGYEQWLKHKYCLPGFVEVEENDIVIDCGAYVGGFSMSAARIGAEVHAFEPDARNAACANYNLGRFPKAKVEICGLYRTSGQMNLNISSSSVEHSFIQPDDGSIIGSRSVPVISLYDYAKKSHISRFDFAKIEAEGVELEVFEGLADMRPRKLAIDVSPERDGESPAVEFRTLLEKLNYEVRQRGHVMFARLRAPVETSRYPVWGKSEDSSDVSLSPPKVIYSLWLQGLQNAPDLVHLNFERWARLNPNYKVEIFDRERVEDLLHDFPLGIDRLSPQALSDVVRARVLSSNGGIWVDASVLPTSPLDNWLPALMTSSGFFAFEKPGLDRPLSSWFLAATKDNLIMQKWYDSVERYWSVDRILYDGIPSNPSVAVDTWPDQFPYFWFHYLFQSLMDCDVKFSEAWAECKKRSADAPHALQAALAQDPQLELPQIAELAAGAPVHKLNWRNPYPLATLSVLP